MGGNAIKAFGNVLRLPKEEYDEVTLDVLARITTYLDGHEKICQCPVVVPAYNNKPDFGDIDIVVDDLFWYFNEIEEIKDALNSPGYVKNDTVISFAVPYKNGNVQVDIISVQKSKFDFAVNYFSFNDLGCFIGVVSKNLAFSFGHQGLYYSLYDDDNKTRLVDKILVTDNYEEAITFLGYNYQRFLNGFDDLEDVYQFALSSPYAYRDLFLLENRNSDARNRDKKRKVYMQFLDWLDMSKTSGLRPMSDQTREILRRTTLQRALDRFQPFFVRLNEVKQNHEKEKRVKKIINGKNISEITGYVDIELGFFMRLFNTVYPMSKIIDYTDDELLDTVHTLYSDCKGTINGK